MLYNKYLDTFLKVADSGSFNKAAAKMFITPSAVIKQITALEEDIGISLFKRSHHGLELTESGKSLYSDARLLIDSATRAVERAKALTGGSDNVMRIGVSPTTPADVLTNLYPAIYRQWPDLKFQMIPFENTPENASEILKNLGENIDIVGGVFDEVHLKYRKCNGLELYREPLQVAISMHHRLSDRTSISVTELYGETLLLLSTEKMKSMDLLRDYLNRNHPQIKIEDFDFYDMSIFNKCESTNKLLVTNGTWLRAHPLLRTVSVEWSFEIPYGLLYSTSPSAKVKRFLQIIQKSLRLWFILNSIYKFPKRDFRFSAGCL